MILTPHNVTAAAADPAQGTFPSGLVKIMVGFPAGTAPDTLARLLADRFKEALGKYSLGLFRPRARHEPMGGCGPICTWEALGYLASALVLAAFCMKDMVPPRFNALASNLSFIAYGAALGLTPIWLLHILLLLVMDG